MKKITLLFSALLTFSFGYAQDGDTCGTAITLSAGVQETVAAYAGAVPGAGVEDCAPNAGGDPREFAEWYVYNPAMTVAATVTSDLPGSAAADTRLTVYSGDCMNLVCVVGADDIDFNGGNFLSEATFVAEAGVTYYLVWDNQWAEFGDAPFDFILNETTIDCTYNRPYNEVYDDPVQFIACFVEEDVDGDGLSWITQQDLDLDGDMTNETFATNASGDPAALGTKDDWMISPALNLIGGTEYTITTNFNVVGGDPVDNASLEAFILDGQSSTANQMATLFSNTGIVSQGDFATLETMAYSEVHTFTPLSTGDYHVAYRSFGPSGSGFILVFDTILEATLSVSDFEENVFTHRYNKDTDQLTLESSSFELSSIEMHNILGQQVLSRTLSSNTEVIDMSGLQDGLYLAKVSIQGQSQIIKVLKQ